MAMLVFLYTYRPTMLLTQRGKRTPLAGLNSIKIGGGLSHLASTKIPKKQANSFTPLPRGM